MITSSNIHRLTHGNGHASGWALLAICSTLGAAGCGDATDTGDSVGSGGAAQASGGATLGSGGDSNTASGGSIMSSGGASGGESNQGSGGLTTSGGSGSGGDVGSGGAESLDPSELIDGLDGYLYKGACDGGNASFECPLSACQGGVFTEDVDFAVSGDEGKIYEITMHIYGVVELRDDYTGGMRRQGNTSNNESMADFWYTGGKYTPGAGYNVYGLRVEPAVDGEPVTDNGNNYFLNARDSSPEGHEVYKLDYEVTIPVPAGGKVSFKAYDPNCLQIMNNEETVRPNGSGTGPNGSIVISEVDSAMPSPDGFVQPLSSGNNRTGQWIFIDVTQVAVKP